ncbi:MAG: cytochrome C oxidase subunit IV family protein [Bacteroidota bacterium]|jgi:cytochrome c oxidase subunit IV
MEFNDGYPSYEMMALHDEEHGKHVRKVIWKVFWIMLGVTLVELFVGFQAEAWALSKTFLKVFFIGLTIVKAAYIVMSFMHLGDEVKALKWVILGPFIVLILYLVFMVDLGEGNYAKERRYVMDKNVTNAAHHDAGAKHEGGEGHH